MFPFASADLSKENRVLLKFFKWVRKQKDRKQKNIWYIRLIWENFILWKCEIYEV